MEWIPFLSEFCLKTHRKVFIQNHLKNTWNYKKSYHVENITSHKKVHPEKYLFKSFKKMWCKRCCTFWANTIMIAKIVTKRQVEFKENQTQLANRGFNYKKIGSCPSWHSMHWASYHKKRVFFIKVSHNYKKP